MKLKTKSLIIFVIALLIMLIGATNVKAVENTDIPFCQDDNIFVSWTVKNQQGEQVTDIRGGGDYGFQDLVIPGYNDYTNCYFELTVNANIGNTLNIDNFGTFYYTGKKSSTEMGYEEDMEDWYIYKHDISDPTRYNKAIEAQQFSFTITTQETNKTYIAWLDYKVAGERKVYKIESNNIGIDIDAGSDKELTLETKELPKDSDVYVEMIEYINKKCDNNYLASFDISLTGGEYKGDLTITFTVGTKYNGKTICIAHKKKNGTIEHFKEVVKDGKVTITVKELSPFVLAVEKETSSNQQQETEKQQTPPVANNKEKLDNTPKTGTTDIIKYIVPITIVSAIGVVALRKKKETK